MLLRLKRLLCRSLHTHIVQREAEAIVVHVVIRKEPEQNLNLLVTGLCRNRAVELNPAAALAKKHQPRRRISLQKLRATFIEEVHLDTALR